MTWELVAQIALLVLVATFFVLILTGIYSAVMDARLKRQIQLFEAELRAKGWNHNE